jgi:hypothetical protein
MVRVCAVVMAWTIRDCVRGVDVCWCKYMRRMRTTVCDVQWSEDLAAFFATCQDPPAASSELYDPTALYVRASNTPRHEPADPAYPAPPRPIVPPPPPADTRTARARTQ